jgi:hypothetical protein
MNFLNLSLGELVGLVGAISAGVVALYMLDRSKRHHLVSTLRFWTNADVRTELKHRRRIQQPLSLILQLVSLALLLAAIAGPRFGVIDGAGLDHVLIVDTSAWMGATLPGGNQQGTLIDLARTAARAYVRSLPRRDRVMVVRADALATPATGFESSRQAIEEAIRQSQPSASALSLEHALAFAGRAQRLEGQRAGEIVFIGAGRVRDQEAGFASLPSNLRVVSVGAAQENVGLRRIGMRRAPGSPDTWQIFVVVRNYGTRPQTVDLTLQYARSPAGARRMTLAPGVEEQAQFNYLERAGGWLEARVAAVNPQAARDAFPGDNRAIVEVDSQVWLHAAVYSENPELLRPLFGSNAQVEAEFAPPERYDPNVKADLVVLDGFAPRIPPVANAIWIEPPADASPVPVKARRSRVQLRRWRTDTPLGEGLRNADVTLESAEVFTPAAGDMVVAESDDGAVVVARSGRRKTVVLGFHPGRGTMKYELATPLLTANILRWVTPGTFQRVEMQAASAGLVTVSVDKDTNPATVRVLDENRTELPFTVDNGSLRFFSGAPGRVRVRMEDRELVYSLTLPDIAEAAWRVPAGVKKGVPRGVGQAALPTDIWPWLALAGGLGLLIDWLMFGRSRAFRLRGGQIAMPAPSTWKAPWRKAS